MYNSMPIEKKISMLLILERDRQGVFKFGSDFFSHALFACLSAGLYS